MADHNKAPGASTAGVWIQVAAGLKNPAMRELLGQVLTGQDPERGAAGARSSKDLARWEQIGLLRRGQTGAWELNEQLLGDTLAAAGAAKADRSGINRFFDGTKLHTLPAKPADRMQVMAYLRDAVIGGDEQLREDQVNERLRVFHPDTALIRRYLVDHGLLLRAVDGSSYRRGAGQPAA